MAKRRSTHRRTKAPEGPTCHCLLLCDDVNQSLARRKMSINGVIGAFFVNQIPAAVGPMCVFARVANVLKPQRLSVSFERADDEEKLWEFEAQLADLKDPLAVHTIAVPIPPFELQMAGKYLLIVKNEGIPFAQAPILVIQAQE